MSNLLPALFLSRHVTLVGLPVLENGDLAGGGAHPLAKAKRRVLQTILRRTERVFALSEGIETELLQHGVERTRIVRVGNPVTDCFANDSRSIPVSRPLRIGFVGKLGITKRPDLLLGAQALLKAEGVAVRTVFAGPFANAEYETFFSGEVARLSLGNEVSLLGYQSSMSDVFRDAIDLFVLPSTSEGMPGALAEAMYSAIPCLVTDVGAMGDVIRQAECGFIIDATSESIARHITTLLADPSLWLRYSVNAKNHAAAHFSDRAVAKLYSDALHL